MNAIKRVLIIITMGIMLVSNVAFASSWDATDVKHFYFDNPGPGTESLIITLNQNAGFTANKYLNQSRTTVLTSFKNSHVLHINTHGNSGYIAIPGYSSITYSTISDTFENLPGLKFVYLDACKVAATPYFQNALQSCGVMSSIAFSQNVTNPSSYGGINYYSMLLFYYLSQGVNLNTAAANACNAALDLYPNCGCESAVVVGGTYAVTPDVTTFVNRMYQNCFERTPDVSGYNAWKNVLVNHVAGGKTVANGFFSSTEFQNLSLTNTEYVIRLYHTMMGREPDSAGLETWVNALNNGSTRLTVFNGFADSQEFANVCSTMGISVT